MAWKTEAYNDCSAGGLAQTHSHQRSSATISSACCQTMTKRTIKSTTSRNKAGKAPPLQLFYNPSRPGNRGYRCALAAAKARVSHRTNSLLRGEVARIIIDKCEKDGILASIPIRGLVWASGLGIEAYAAATACNLGASQAEIEAMAILRGPNWGLFLYQRVPH